jgi:hypothetical protein
MLLFLGASEAKTRTQSSEHGVIATGNMETSQVQLRRTAGTYRCGSGPVGTRRLAEAAAGTEELAGDRLQVVGGEEGGDGRDAIDLTDAAERGLGDGALLEVRADEAAVCVPSVSTMPGLMAQGIHSRQSSAP